MSKKPILILVNPHSGRGKSMKIFKKQVEQILNTNRVPHEVFVTTKDIRVKEFLDRKTQKELSSYQSILVISGDGLLYETVNACMNREDWQREMKLPIGLVPTGSGNGLAHSLIKLSGLSVRDLTEAVRVCCERAIQGQLCTSDLVKITYDKGTRTIWSFLSIGWGILADIDIDSEWLRCLGEFRFTLYGILKVITSVSRRGRLSYVVAPNLPQELKSKLANESNADATMYGEADDDKANVNPEGIGKSAQGNNDESWIHIEDKFLCLYAVHQPFVNSNTNFSPKSTLADQVTYLTYIRGKVNAYQALKFLMSIENGSHEKLPFVRVVPVQTFKFQPIDPSIVVVDGETIQWDVSQGPLVAQVIPKILKLSWPLPQDTSKQTLAI